MNGKSPSPLQTIRPPVSGGSSPHNRQKRTDDESYIPNQMAHSTSPHQSEILTRPSTAPDQDMLQHIAAQPSLEQNRSGALRFERAVASSTTTTTTTTSTPKPDSLGVSATPKVENARTFLDAMDDFQDQLNEEYRLFEQKLKQGDQDVELEDFDWEQLEARYHAEVDPIVESEQAIMNDCSRLFQVMTLSVDSNAV